MIALHGTFLARLNSCAYAAAPTAREQLSLTSVVFPGNVLASRLQWPRSLSTYRELMCDFLLGNLPSLRLHCYRESRSPQKMGHGSPRRPLT